MNCLRKISSFLGAGVFLVISGVRLSACGLDWKMPENHFDGVNEQGYVSYWKKIGKLDLEDDLHIPLVFNFNSGRASKSPYLGAGWILPLLESNLVQVSDTVFLVTLPDGLKVRLWRTSPSDTTLTGQAGAWAASLGDKTTTLWAKCGWKLVYFEGKLMSITTPQNRELDLVYQNGIVKEIDENGSPVLTTSFDLTTGLLSGLSFGGKQVSFSEKDRPEVDLINGQRVIGLVEPSLSTVVITDGTTESYKFAVNPQLVPTLNVLGPKSRSFSWSPDTKLISTDGEWTYKINPGASPLDNAQIARNNTLNQREFWFNDQQKGEETSQDLDGSKTVEERFVTGVLRGKVRKLSTSNGNGKSSETDFIYDENGKMIRKLATENGVTSTTLFKYTDDGLGMGEVRDGRMVRSVSYLSNGKVDRVINFNLDSICVFNYDNNISRFQIVPLDPQTLAAESAKYLGAR